MYLPAKENNLILSKEYLIHEYIENKKSLSDIAIEYGCTRQFIHKKLNEYGIQHRNKRDASLLAFEKNKFSYSTVDGDGNTKIINRIKSEVDEYFFSYWSAPMAWVLGFIYADGNLYAGIRKRSRTPEFRLIMAQKEPEILEKIKVLMRSNQKLGFSKQRIYGNIIAGERYELGIRSKQIFSDLVKIGLTPNKSLTITFPDVPSEYIWHFIRGCWDGDGSLYIENKIGKLRGDYVSGSKDFMEKLVEIIKKELSIENITIHKKRNSYYIKLSAKNCLKLCHHFYDGVSPDLYLSRKFNVYMNYLDRSMSKEILRVRDKT